MSHPLANFTNANASSQQRQFYRSVPLSDSERGLLQPSWMSLSNEIYVAKWVPDSVRRMCVSRAPIEWAGSGVFTLELLSPPSNHDGYFFFDLFFLFCSDTHNAIHTLEVGLIACVCAGMLYGAFAVQCLPLAYKAHCTRIMNITMQYILCIYVYNI